jgi:hypothetical protein
MKPNSVAKTIMEPARETRVCREADVVVVGGGPGGHSAAVAAARNGADTVLVERYGHLGGMATGGLVILIPHMSDGTSEQQIAGLCQEWLDRLDARGAAVHPKKNEVGSGDKEIVSYWRDFSHFFVCEEGRVQLSAVVDPEILKCVLNDMVAEAGVKLFLHSWGTQAIADNGEVKGVIFESKSGRQAILAKVVIDGTGDGDLLPSAGAEFIRQIDPKLRISKAALCFQLGNVDARRFSEFKQSEQKKYNELMHELINLDGFPVYLKTTREDVVWFNNFLPGLDILNVEDLTWVEVNVRKRMLITYDFFKKNMPGFEDSFILNTAPQLGTRGSRRVVGEYMLTEKDINSGIVFDDTIAVCPNIRHVISPEYPHIHIPYRSLVPRQVERLLVAGRSFSSEDVVNEAYNLITHCVAMGQAAGTAAALAVKGGIRLRDVDYAVLQDRLISQGVPLPGVTRAGAKR